MELLVDSHHGTYIPQIFAQIYGMQENFQNWEVVENDINFLKQENSHESEEYNEVWDRVLNNAKLKGDSTLYHNEDLWAIDKDFNVEN